MKPNGIVRPKVHQLTNAFEGFLRCGNGIWCRPEESKLYRNGGLQGSRKLDEQIPWGIYYPGQCWVIWHHPCLVLSSSRSLAKALNVGIRPRKIHEPRRMESPCAQNILRFENVQFFKRSGNLKNILQRIPDTLEAFNKSLLNQQMNHKN